MSHFGRSGPPDIRDTYSLLVLNITFRTTPDDLMPLFDRYGRVQDIFIPRDRRTGESRGFAFVRYKHADEAHKAIDRLDGREVDGREIMVKYAKYGRNDESVRGGGRGRDSDRGGRRDYRDSRDYRGRDRSRDRGDRDRSRDDSRRGRERERERSSRRGTRSPDRYRSRHTSRSPSHSRSRGRSLSRSRSPRRDRSASRSPDRRSLSPRKNRSISLSRSPDEDRSKFDRKRADSQEKSLSPPQSKEEEAVKEGDRTVAPVESAEAGEAMEAEKDAENEVEPVVEVPDDGAGIIEIAVVNEEVKAAPEEDA